MTPELVEKVADEIYEYGVVCQSLSQEIAKTVIPIIESALLREMKEPSLKMKMAGNRALADNGDESIIQISGIVWPAMLEVFARERGLLEGEE